MNSSRKKLLIVGVGSIGERHVRCFLQTGRVDVTICDTNENLRCSVAERYEIAGQFKSLDEALNYGVDAAVIATPAALHIPLAIQTAHEGVHLLIEKPLSVSMEGLDELARICAEQKLTAAVAYVMRTHPALAEARKAIQLKQFGKPLQVVTVSGQNFPFYRPTYRDTYYADRASGGGAVQDALTHFVNAVEWIVGPVDRLLADADHLSLPGVEVEDTVHVIAHHGETLAAYTLNQHQAPNESTITIACERGTVRISLHSNSWAFMQDPQSEWTVRTFAALERDDLFIRQANAFLDAISGKAEVICTLDEGAATLNVNLAILSALDQTKWTTLPIS